MECHGLLRKGRCALGRDHERGIYRFDGQSVNYVDSSVSGNKIFPKASSHCTHGVTAYLHRPYLTPRFAGILNARMRPSALINDRPTNKRVLNTEIKIERLSLWYRQFYGRYEVTLFVSAFENEILDK